jgi:hypothetical protein
MLKRIEKSWPFISLSLLAVILAFQFFWPTNIRPLSLIVMGIGLAAMTAFTVQRHLPAYQEKKSERQALIRNILADIFVALFTMALAILPGGRAGVYAGQIIGREAEAIRIGWGVPASILAGVLAGLAVGFCVGWMMQRIWKRLKKAKVPVES